MRKSVPTRPAPRAPRKKRFLHAFYLVQPVLQFFALVAAIGILSRCSPISPSTDKPQIPGIKTHETAQSPRADSQAQEELVQKAMKEISMGDLAIAGEGDFDRDHRDILNADQPFDDTDVRERAIRRAKHRLGETLTGSKILLVSLNDKIWKDGAVRINLSERLRGDAKAKKALLQLLKSEHEKLNLDAVGHLVLPDAAMRDEYKDISVQFRISLSVIAEDRAFLEIRHVDDEEKRGRNLTALEPAIRAARLLAITLE